MNNNEVQIKKLHAHLNTTERYDKNVFPRPFFVELNGTPTSGKSTVIKQLYNFLKRSGFKVLMPQEGAEVVPHTERKSPVYNIRTGIYALQIFLKLREGHEYDFVLFDRCIFDTYSWMIFLHETGDLTEDEMRLYQNFFLSPLWIHDLDAIYCLVCDPKVALERENKIALSDKQGDTTNHHTIQKLIACNQRAYDELKNRFPQLRFINTTHLTPEQMVRQIAEDLMNTVSK